MSTYVDANSALVIALSEESKDYEFKYTRVMTDGATSHRIIMGRMMCKCESSYPEYFDIISTYGFPTAKEANAFLNGLIAMNDLVLGTPVTAKDDPHYVIKF